MSQNNLRRSWASWHRLVVDGALSLTMTVPPLVPRRNRGSRPSYRLYIEVEVFGSTEYYSYISPAVDLDE